MLIFAMIDLYSYTPYMNIKDSEVEMKMQGAVGKYCHVFSDWRRGLDW
jgi:hypothetical protein